MLYKVSDEASFEAAKEWCTLAQELTEEESEAARCFTLVLCGTTHDLDEADEADDVPNVVPIATASMRCRWRDCPPMRRWRRRRIRSGGGRLRRLRPATLRARAGSTR